MPPTISSALLPEFDHETANTRRVLERVPLDRSTWTPHGRSMTMGRLATHLAQIPVWVTLGLTLDEFDLTPSFEPAEATTSGELLEVFDGEVARARSLLAGAEDARLMQPWTFKKDGHVVFAMPRVVVVRTFVMNHMIHHRGQLSVYLRMNDVPVPSLYGPSADEG